MDKIKEAELTEIRNSLYDNLPTGSVDSFDLITIIKEHLSKLDKFIDSIPPISTQSQKWVKTSERLPLRDGWYNCKKKPITNDEVYERDVFFDGHQFKSGHTVLEWQEKPSSTHPLQAKITELLEVNQGLREALAGVIKSWDSRSHEREEKKNTHGFDYWSPIASMVDSSAIAAAREALETYK